MQEKNALFTKTGMYLLPLIDLNLVSVVSVNQSPWRVLLVNTQSLIYILLNGRTVIRRNFCVVFFNVLESVEILIPQHSLRS